MSSTQPIIWLNAIPASSGEIQIDVHAQNVPLNLFGASFHLEGKGVGFDLFDYKAGNVFAVDPLMLVKQKDVNGHCIVVGTSLKREDLLQAKDGVLMSLVIRPDEQGKLNFVFDNAVLSKFENGRQDILDVEWRGQEIVINNVIPVPQSSSNEPEPETMVDDDVLVIEDESETQKSMTQQDGQAMLFNARNELLDVYVFLFFAFIILLIGFIVWLLATKGLMKPIMDKICFWNRDDDSKY
jgi:hypothetical protein